MVVGVGNSLEDTKLLNKEAAEDTENRNLKLRRHFMISKSERVGVSYLKCDG
jgi:hypothetical protein